MDWTKMPQPSRVRILSDDGDYESWRNYFRRLSPLEVYTDKNYTLCVSRRMRKIWDEPTILWKSKINDGQIICSNMIDVSYEASVQPLVYSALAANSGGEICKLDALKPHLGFWYGADAYPGLPTSFQSALNVIAPDSGSLRGEAVTKSFAKVDISELEMLASLGEMPETVEWFRDVLKRLMTITLAIKQKRLLQLLKPPKTTSRKAKRSLKASEDSWMELRYAIRPLVFEVAAYLNALDSKLEKAVRKTARSKNVITTSNESTTVGPASLFPTSNFRETVTTRSISAGVLYSLDPTKTGWWTHLGLDAPVSAAWAITSLSFVYDWFFNIGEWIASWEPRVGLTPLANWVVETRTETITDTVTPGIITSTTWPGYYPIEQNIVQPGGGSRSLKFKVRWANPDRQILPTFRMKNLDTYQVLDLTIILRKIISQMFR